MSELSKQCRIGCRRGTTTVLIVLVSACFIADTSSMYADEPKGDAVDRIARAQGKYQLAAAYRDLLSAPPKEVATLMQHPQRGIAMQAAWQRVRRTMTAEHPSRANEQTVPIDALALQRFLGFVEGCLPVQAPEWWTAHFVDARYYAPVRDLLWFHNHRKVSPYHRTESGWLTHVRIDEIVEEGGAIKIETNGSVVSVPQKLLVSAVANGLDYGLVAAILDSERFVVAPHSDQCGTFPVYCLARDSGALIWDAEVWASDLAFGRTGTGYTQWVECMVRDDKLYVFGADAHCAFIEGFAIDTGRNLFRFSTSY